MEFPLDIDSLHKAGLDLVTEFVVQDYNAHIKKLNLPLKELETFGREKTKASRLKYYVYFYRANRTTLGTSVYDGCINRDI
mmetsp:Transcript_13888/g.16117  ORF Transcript_13888/g.16117 Transcript_13888/m.16117 type:complete len:81 (+) Transcript_13888:117-359(+)